MANEQDILAQCAEICTEEWTVLSAVYPEYTSHSEPPSLTRTAPVSIRLEVPVEIEEQKIEIVPELNLAGQSQQEDSITVSLRNLPPLILTLLLPPTYPLRVPPLLVHLHSANSWLNASAINSLHESLSQMWQDDVDTGSSTGSLWRMCEWIRGGSFLTNDSDHIRLAHPKPSILAKRLKDHDNAINMDNFAQTKFDCQICLSTVRGAKCIRLDCSHVFCRSCLNEFWSLCITEGDVDRVMCADPQCVKENRQVTEDEVLRVVTTAEAQRWKAIKRKRALEKDPGLVYCPMAFCQGPCPSPMAQRGLMERETKTVDDETMRREYVSLRTCENCDYSFCMLCKRAWHGLAPCSSDITSKFLEQYMTLEEGHPERLALERKFGKAQLIRLVNKLQEDEENRKWLELSTTKCPNCLVSCEKSYGCNHMTCMRCSTHFCYLCGRKLPGDRPYNHFSERGPCK
ncbi:hypothetical protein M408DRAFT_60662 [Serendipita vermifera MAFF 305830]|uniref:RBR-type E3 ubiquitin transferase n=1 Tax=Serendipita vermifera MAFF 305830 TaxID=933852 RepID=A0A0C3BPX9_SERVB|nr:hypothetical protein M408DRAFT_60662 [Serendipita vermifera MAFF 305830]